MPERNIIYSSIRETLKRHIGTSGREAGYRSSAEVPGYTSKRRLAGIPSRKCLPIRICGQNLKKNPMKNSLHNSLRFPQLPCQCGFSRAAAADDHNTLHIPSLLRKKRRSHSDCVVFRILLNTTDASISMRCPSRPSYWRACRSRGTCRPGFPGRRGCSGRTYRPFPS